MRWYLTARRSRWKSSSHVNEKNMCHNRRSCTGMFFAGAGSVHVCSLQYYTVCIILIKWNRRPCHHNTNPRSDQSSTASWNYDISVKFFGFTFLWCNLHLCIMWTLCGQSLMTVWQTLSTSGSTPVSKNMPLVAGGLRWIQELQERIQNPFSKFGNISFPWVSSHRQQKNAYFLRGCAFPAVSLCIRRFFYGSFFA